MQKVLNCHKRLLFIDYVITRFIIGLKYGHKRRRSLTLIRLRYVSSSLREWAVHVKLVVASFMQQPMSYGGL